jgi:predicted nucleotidyltransferase
MVPAIETLLSSTTRPVHRRGRSEHGFCKRRGRALGSSRFRSTDVTLPRFITDIHNGLGWSGRDCKWVSNGHTSSKVGAMAAIQELAREIGVDERTLRRAAAQGTLRCRRLGPRRLQLGERERAYLRGHWRMLSELRQALRTEQDVSLAVLYGSAARGDDEANSDLDLIVELRPDRDPRVHRRLAQRLGKRLGRDIDVAQSDRIQFADPLLWSRVVEEGRVLVDRDGRWSELRERRRAIRARADRAYQRDMAATATAIEELTQN